ncbi:MAG: pyrroline-5-carboxylate reductase [Micrococcales bacterium]|nr:pyrroline-5-carboxylate reductase [Micrococcales bacterium]
MRYGFIGTGAMAGAIIGALVNDGYALPSEICAYDLDEGRLQQVASSTGIEAMAGNQEVAEASPTVILAVKPAFMDQVLREMATQIVARRRLVVSIAAGVKLARLESWLSPKVPIIRAMPNLNVKVGAGMTAVAPNAAVNPAQVRDTLELFAGMGQAVQIEERLFGAFTAVAGSSPAWVFLMVEALARGALAAGMSKAQALEVATQAVLGSAKLLSASQLHPWALIDQVSSPGGTTVAGLTELEERGFSAAVVAAVAATVKREAELAG